MTLTHSLSPQAEARLAAKRAARAEAREIRMKELERQQKEVVRTSTPLHTVVVHTGPRVTWPVVILSDIFSILLMFDVVPQH